MSGSYPVLSLIQGVSNQSAFSRPQASAESQKNCINDLLRGARARGGSRVLGIHNWNLTGAFMHRIERNALEDYLLVYTAGDLRIINLVSGNLCTVTPDIYWSYIYDILAHSGPTRLALCAATVNDVTFLCNRQNVVRMSDVTSPPRQKQGIAHFRSSNYSTEYKLTISVPSTGMSYTATYKTPDNSSSGNADFIATNRLAEEFKNAIFSLLSGAGPGWTVLRSGSSILITHDNLDFKLTTEDGLGGQQFISFTDRVKDVARLPVSCWNGYKVAVGSSKSNSDVDYYLEYVGGAQDGVWKEIVAPSTKTGLDPATMPLHLVNTGYETFTIGYAPWGARLAGDGVNSSKDPSFVGTNIMDLQFIDGRLAIITRGSWTLSRARNGYVFFPDTAQTNLDTDPIDYTVANGKSTDITRGVVVSEKLQLWGNRLQCAVSGGQDSIREKNAETPPITSYEYDGLIPPIPVGQSGLVFATSDGIENQIMEVFYRNGVPVGEININAHCPALTSGTIRLMEVGGTARMVLILTDEEPNKCFVYQWYNNGEERVQSAWNVWTMEGCDEIVWIGMSGSTARCVVRRGTTTTVESLELKPNTDEPGMIQLRADHRLHESVLTRSMVGPETLRVWLPWGLSTAQRENFVLYERVDNDATEEQRGRLHQVTWVADNSFTIRSSNAGLRFWVGHVPVAEREPGRLYISGQDGTAMLDALYLESVSVQHKDSTYYEVHVIPDAPNQPTRKEYFTARRVGDAGLRNNRLAMSKDGRSVPTKIGYRSDECRLLLRNPSVYPSSWEGMEYIYRMEKRHR